MRLVEILTKDPKVNVYESGDSVLGTKGAVKTKLYVSGISEEDLKNLASKLGTIGLTNNGLFKYKEGDKDVRVSILARSIEEELRAATQNIYAVAYDYSSNKLIDPLGQKPIIDKKIVKIINIHELIEHPVYILDLVINAINAGFVLDFKAKRTIRKLKKTLALEDPAKIGFRMREIVRSNKARKILKEFGYLGILSVIFPKLEQNAKIIQTRKSGHPSVKEHSLLSMESVSQENELVRWAALFHDLGKCDTMQKTGSTIRFYGHEDVGASLAFNTLTKWGFNLDFSRAVAILVKNHMFEAGPHVTVEGIRRLIRKVGKNHIMDLLELRIADCAGAIPPNNARWRIDPFRDRIVEELKRNPFSVDAVNISIGTIQYITSITKAEAEVVKELLLDLVLFYGMPNKEKNLAAWVASSNFSKMSNFCPLGLSWLLSTQIARIEGRAEENKDGTLSCGKYCEYNCDNKGDELWKY